MKRVWREHGTDQRYNGVDTPSRRRHRLTSLQLHTYVVNLLVLGQLSL